MSLKMLAELNTKRNTLVTEARGILDKADSEKRGLTTEESARYDTILADQDTVKKDAERVQRQIDLDREMATRSNDPASIDTKKDKDEKRALTPRETPEYREAFARYLSMGARGISADEMRALSAGSNVDGGYTVAPLQMAQGMIQAMDNAVIIRQMATKIAVTKAMALGAVSLDADPGDATWTAEIQTGSEDSSMAFGRRELNPHPLARRIKISNKLLQVSSLPIEQIVMQRLAYKFGITQEKAFMTGTGSNQPLGLFTASSLGISTARDVSLDNTATAMTFDGLLNAKYSLKGQYQATASWFFHRDGVKQLAKIKDSTGQYIWQPAKTLGEPDMLLGRPVIQSEYIPNTFTTGLYVGMFGDMSFYWIADAMDMQMQVLKELYAETNQTGYIGRLECDAMPVLEEAFARVKLG